MCPVLKCCELPLTLTRLMMFVHLTRMDESADARRILTADPKSDWKRSAERPHIPLLAIMKSWHWTDQSGGYWQQQSYTLNKQ